MDVNSSMQYQTGNMSSSWIATKCCKCKVDVCNCKTMVTIKTNVFKNGQVKVVTRQKGKLSRFLRIILVIKVT